MDPQPRPLHRQRCVRGRRRGRRVGVELGLPREIVQVTPSRVQGLDVDYQRVKPPNGDGFVNWLTTHLINALDHTAASHVRARIVEHDGVEICRVDVGRSPRPLLAKTSAKEGAFFVRLNNSTRPLTVDEQPTYVSEHWSQTSASSASTSSKGEDRE